MILEHRLPGHDPWPTTPPGPARATRLPMAGLLLSAGPTAVTYVTGTQDDAPRPLSAPKGAIR